MTVTAKMVPVVQGSPEWQALRRGRITASRMGDVMAGKQTKRYREYQQSIVLELLGFEDEEASGPWYEHGKAMEPYARAAYEWKYGIELTQDVLFIHPTYDWLSASPDGVRVETFDDPVEIKCRAPHECRDRHGLLASCGGCGDPLRTYRHIVSEQERTGMIEAAYRPQVQAQMFVMGCADIRFINYYHDAELRVRKLHVMTVARDKDYIERMEQRALEFMIECYRLAEKDPGRLAA